MTWPLAIDSGVAALAAGVLVGAVLLAGGVIAHRLSQRRGEQTARRGETRATLRGEAYMRFFTAAENLRAVPGTTSRRHPLQREFDAAAQQVHLWAGPAVREALEEFLKWREANRGLEEIGAWERAEGALLVAMWDEQEAAR